MHRKRQREAGINVDVADKINRLLDEPPVPSLTHGEWRKLTHSPSGLALMRLALGETAFKAAVHHVALDLTVQQLKKMVRKSGWFRQPVM